MNTPADVNPLITLPNSPEQIDLPKEFSVSFKGRIVKRLAWHSFQKGILNSVSLCFFKFCDALIRCHLASKDIKKNQSYVEYIKFRSLVSQKQMITFAQEGNIKASLNLQAAELKVQIHTQPEKDFSPLKDLKKNLTFTEQNKKINQLKKTFYEEVNLRNQWRENKLLLQEINQIDAVRPETYQSITELFKVFNRPELNQSWKAYKEMDDAKNTVMQALPDALNDHKDIAVGKEEIKKNFLATLNVYKNEEEQFEADFTKKLKEKLDHQITQIKGVVKKEELQASDGQARLLLLEAKALQMKLIAANYPFPELHEELGLKNSIYNEPVYCEQGIKPGVFEREVSYEKVIEAFDLFFKVKAKDQPNIPQQPVIEIETPELAIVEVIQPVEPIKEEPKPEPSLIKPAENNKPEEKDEVIAKPLSIEEPPRDIINQEEEEEVNEEEEEALDDPKPEEVVNVIMPLPVQNLSEDEIAMLQKFGLPEGIFKSVTNYLILHNAEKIKTIELIENLKKWTHSGMFGFGEKAGQEKFIALVNHLVVSQDEFEKSIQNLTAQDQEKMKNDLNELIEYVIKKITPKVPDSVKEKDALKRINEALFSKLAAF